MEYLEREIKLIFSALSSGCMTDEKYVDEERARALVKRLIEFIAVCYPYKEESMRKFIDEAVKNEIIKEYIKEISYKWVILLGLAYKRVDGFKGKCEYSGICRTLSELTDISYNYENIEMLLFSENQKNMANFVVGNFISISSLNYNIISGFTLMMFYFIKNYADKKIIEEVYDLINFEALPNDFGELNW